MLHRHAGAESCPAGSPQASYLSLSASNAAIEDGSVQFADLHLERLSNCNWSMAGGVAAVSFPEEEGHTERLHMIWKDATLECSIQNGATVLQAMHGATLDLPQTCGS